MLWEGTIQTKPVTLTIDSFSQNEIGNLYEDIADSKATSDTRRTALKRIKRSQVSPSSTEVGVLERVYGGSDTEARTLIIKVLRCALPLEGVTAITEILKTEMDPLLRAEAMVSLGKLNTAKARALVLDELVSRREGSYRAAVVILGQIGDASAVIALREVATHDETEWVRMKAGKSIEEIEKRLTAGKK